jgi:hypothetical protein
MEGGTASLAFRDASTVHRRPVGRPASSRGSEHHAKH